MIIAITGTIGAGKSSVAHFFKNKGYSVYDTDKMVHRYYEKGAVAYNWLLASYGNSILDDTQALDRQKLADRVFSSKESLEKLENFIFPIVREEILELKVKHKDDIAFIEVPLLFEAKMETLFDKIITVDAFSKIRHQRLLNKGLSLRDIRSREKRQYGSVKKKSMSDIVVNNNKDLEHLNHLLNYVERGEIL